MGAPIQAFLVVRSALFVALATMGCAAADCGRDTPMPVRTQPAPVVAVPSAAPEPTPAISSAARLAPSVLAIASCDEASKRIVALDEAKEKLADSGNSIRCTADGARYTLTLGRGPDDAFELVFVLDAKSGAISVESDRHERFDREHPLPLDEWRDELKARREAAAKVAALPEVKGWEKGLRAARLDLGFWLDSEPPKRGCTAGDPECAWSFYVGEIHPDHSVRRVTILVDRTSGAISVADLGGDVHSYAEWKKSSTAALMRAGK